MKKFASLFVAAVLMLVGLPTAEAKTYNIRFTTNLFEKHPLVANGFKPWFADVQKNTGDQVKIKFFNPNTICPEKDIAASVINGSLDMGSNTPNRNVNEFPLHSVFNLALLANSAVGEGLLAKRVADEFPRFRKEYDKMHFLGYWGGGVMNVMTCNKQVKTLEDLKGLRIICFDKELGDIATALGANPVFVGFPDAYMALARHQADGILAAPLACPSGKFGEHLKYVTLLGLQSDCRWTGMNQKLWNKLPADIQKVFDTMSDNEDFTRRISQSLDDGDKAGREYLIKCGVEFYTPDKEEIARWEARLLPMREKWVDRMVEGGFASREEAMAILKRTIEISNEIKASESAK